MEADNYLFAKETQFPNVSKPSFLSSMSIFRGVSWTRPWYGWWKYYKTFLPHLELRIWSPPKARQILPVNSFTAHHSHGRNEAIRSRKMWLGLVRPLWNSRNVEPFLLISKAGKACKNWCKYIGFTEGFLPPAKLWNLETWRLSVTCKSHDEKWIVYL